MSRQVTDWGSGMFFYLVSYIVVSMPNSIGFFIMRNAHVARAKAISHPMTQSHRMTFVATR